jgi:DNA-binding Lrp family transcriptional regulator
MTAAKRKRLRPGELDDLVLAYMGKHEADGPLTASAIAKGIGRSSGAVANCLRRLAKAKKLRQAKKAPRAYVTKKASEAG